MRGLSRVFSCALGMLTVAAFASCGSRTLPPETTFWPDGSPREEWTRSADSNGQPVRHGTCLSWHESAILKEQGEYVQGNRTGTWTRWYDIDPPAKLWEGRYVSNLKEGRWVYWHNPSHAQGQPSAEHPANEHDHQSLHDELPILKYEHFRAGVAHGEWISWFLNGQTADSMRYEDSRLEGLWHSYYPDGSKQSESEYLNGVLQGSIQMWDTLGNSIIPE